MLTKYWETCTYESHTVVNTIQYRANRHSFDLTYNRFRPTRYENGVRFYTDSAQNQTNSPSTFVLSETPVSIIIVMQKEMKTFVCYAVRQSRLLSLPVVDAQYSCSCNSASRLSHRKRQLVSSAKVKAASYGVLCERFTPVSSPAYGKPTRILTVALLHSLYRSISRHVYTKLGARFYAMYRNPEEKWHEEKNFHVL